MRTLSALHHVLVVFRPCISYHLGEDFLKLISETSEWLSSGDLALGDTLPFKRMTLSRLALLGQRFDTLLSSSCLDGHTNQSTSEQLNIAKLHSIQLHIDRNTVADDQARRPRRGLINLIGDVGKTLFGVATEKDILSLQDAIESNRNEVNSVVHNGKKLLSIVNATKYELSKTQISVNELIVATQELKKWLMDRSLHMGAFHLFMFRMLVIDASVRDLENFNAKVLRMRRDLEVGILSEDLLPLESLRNLINSPDIPAGNEFVEPLTWYYSGLKVEKIKIGDEFVYSFELPLVNKELSVAKEISSYPTPNKDNVTVQVDVPVSMVVLSSTVKGMVNDVRSCFGRKPFVCPPQLFRRGVIQQDEQSCMAGLARGDPEQINRLCEFRVSNDTSEKIFVHDIDTFVLVTWGTEIFESCALNDHHILSAGTYLIKWSGNCPLCTNHFCIPGVIKTGSTLRLESNWFSYNVKNFPKLENMNVTELVRLPKPLEISGQLSMNDVWEESPSARTHFHISIVSDVSIAIVFIIIPVIIVLIIVCRRRYKGRRQPVLQSSNEAQELRTLSEPISPEMASELETITVPLSTKQASAPAKPGMIRIVPSPCSYSS